MTRLLTRLLASAILVAALLVATALVGAPQGARAGGTPDAWHITGGAELSRRDDGTWRIDLDLWVLPQVEPIPTNAPTNTPTSTPSPTPTHTPTTRPTPTPTHTPTPWQTPTQEHTCIVRSTANVNARMLPLVRRDTVIGVLRANSSVLITGYHVEQASATESHIWYRYWFDAEHPDAWSRADFFTERDNTPGCLLLPRVTEP